MELKFFKFFKKEKTFKKASSRLNFYLYWKLAVFSMGVTTLLAFWFGYYLFMEVNKENAISVISDSSQIEKIKKERIDKVLEYFSIRKQKSNQILISPAPVVDPSL